MKSVLMVLAVSSIFLISSTALGDYGAPSLPVDWSSNSSYTSQFWGLHAVDGNEPAQPLAPDNYSDNPFGTASASWVTGSSVGWNNTIPGSQPAWVEGIYGGNVIFDSSGSGPFSINAVIPTGTASGPLQVLVQYDWYDRTASSYPDTPSVITPSVAGVTDITPAEYADEILASYNTLIVKRWVRTTKLFELDNNPGSITVSLGVSGYSPIIDSFSVTTAVVPEPATITVLTIGALGILLKKRTL